MKIEKLAEIIHEANRNFQTSLGQPVDPEWACAGWRQESTLNSIRDMMVGNVDFEAQHARWMNERIASGWTLGPTHDATFKTNPLLLPWSQIPESKKAKNYLRLAIFQALRSQLD